MSSPRDSAWRVLLTFAGLGESLPDFGPFEAALVSSDGFSADGSSGSSIALFRDEANGVWTLNATLDDRPDGEGLARRLAIASAAAGWSPAAVEIAALPPTDWVAEVNRRTPAVTAGRFHVRGTHITQAPPAGCHDIVLDAGPAFGTGSHETTRGCLLAIDGAPAPPPGAAILDLGTGSGILAIAAALRWQRPVLAADNDKMAVAVAAGNAAANGLGGLIETRTSQGFANPRLRGAAPYGLVIANILAVPLIGLAPPIARFLRADGRAILSGLLVEQEDAVAAAYRARGLTVRERIVLGSWPTLVVGRGSSRY